MAVLPILRMGHPVLAGVAAPVADPADPALDRLFGDMADTLDSSGGVGLAAPQIGVPLRVVLVRPPGGAPLTLVNPELEPLDASRALGYEGCLSLPGLMGRVPRFVRLAYRGFAPGGAAVEGEARDYFARILQHECDHLDGVLYPARVEEWSEFGFADEIRRRWEEEA